MKTSIEFLQMSLRSSLDKMDVDVDGDTKLTSSGNGDSIHGMFILYFTFFFDFGQNYVPYSSGYD